MNETVRIAMWSGPRNISTAMMRAWENRPDCAVMDEPFYGAYLATTGADHPMREAVLAAHPADWDAIAEDCATARAAPVVFQKHMASHMVDAAPTAWMAHCRHAILIRAPEAVAASFAKGWPGMGAEHLGFDRLERLAGEAERLTGTAPPVIEARDVLENPEGMLRALCAALGVPFRAEMLAWPAGRRGSDGVWAAHWYAAVERSTGFAPPRPDPEPDPALAPVVAACRPVYDRLHARRLRPAA